MFLEHIIRRGTLLSVIVLIICVLGLAGAMNIPIQMIPDLEVRTISIGTGWPGATPQDVEKEILVEQERYLRTLPNLQRMVSTAESGSAWIELEFPYGTDINETLIRVNNALSQVSGYAENVDQPRIYASSFSSNAFMHFGVTPVPGNPLNLDMDILRDFIEDNVKPRMERVPGVSQVNVNGGASRQIQIQIDPARLAQRGLTLSEVRSTIRARNRDRSAGDLDSGKRRYLMRTVGRFEDIEELESLILDTRGNAVVRLRDVAEVHLDHVEVRSLAWFADERRLHVSVQRETGSNVIDIMDAMMPEVARINEDLLNPNGLQLTLNSEDVRYVKDSVANVWRNLLIGALLATVVMFGFLRSGSATLVAVIGIPICTIAAFIGLHMFGRTINVISLAGIAFAIGMTLDNTIVVLESIEQASRRGLNRMQAAIEGTREVWSAVLACTATTVLVFVPIMFVKQEAGQLYSDIAIAICAAIIASMLVAITVVPTAIGRLGFSGSAKNSGGRFREGLLRGLEGMIAHPIPRWLCILGSIVAMALIVIKLTPPAEYLPEGEEPKAFSRMIAPPGYNLAEMKTIADDVRAGLLPHLDEDPARYDAGEVGMPPLKYFLMSVSSTGLFVLSEPVRTQDIETMMNTLTTRFRSYPGMRAFSARGSIISSNDGGSRAVNLEIAGNDLAQLYATAEAAYRRARELFDQPQVSSDPRSLSLDQPLVEIRPRWNRLAELGVGADEFGYTVAALSDGAYVDDYFLGDDKIDIFMYSHAGAGQNLESLGNQPIQMPNGSVLPLSALAELKETVATDTLRRVDGARTVSLYIVPPRSVALETAVDRVRNTLIPEMRAAGEITDGIIIDISGASDQLEATRESLSNNFLIAVIICYLVLVAIFVHWGYPLLILITVPLGLAGGILGLAAYNGAASMMAESGFAYANQPFDMITMLGFLILLGVVLNNPILIVDRTHHNLRQGMDTIKAVRDAVASRLRAITMSTLTTIIGISPLVFLPGAGTELYRGVGLIVISGLLFSTIITLTFLPSLLVTILNWGPLRRRLVQAP